MKKARFLIFLTVIQMILFISGCKWSIVSVTGPNCASSGETVTIYVKGSCESETNSPSVYGLILQIPNSWFILSATAIVGDHSYNLTENTEYAFLYTPEPGHKIWVGTATESSNSQKTGTATVRLSIGDSGGQVKAAAGSYRNDVWTADDPASEFNFANITEQKYVHSISTAPLNETPLPDTGQTKCYDNSVEIPCPEPGEAFYGQDASYLINPPSYTKLDASGNDLPDDAAEWVMVRDNVTELIWEVKTDDDSIHDKDNTYTWYDSDPATNGGDAGTPGDGTDTKDFIDALNTDNFGDYDDWRLPTIKELASIVNLGRKTMGHMTGSSPVLDRSIAYSS